MLMTELPTIYFQHKQVEVEERKIKVEENVIEINGTVTGEFNGSKVSHLNNYSSSSSTSNFTTEDSNEDTGNKRTGSTLQNRPKRKKIILVQPDYENESVNNETNSETFEFIEMVTKNIHTYY